MTNCHQLKLEAADGTELLEPDPLHMMKTHILFALILFVAAGCNRQPIREVESITVIVADTIENEGTTAPKLYRWVTTNRAHIAELSATIRETMFREPAKSIPECAAQGMIELVDTRGTTNRFSIPHIHDPNVVFLVDDSGKYFAVSHGVQFLQQMSLCGVQTNLLFATWEVGNY